MIDLIKKLKRPDTRVSFDEGYNKAIDDVIQLFNQHNIITAPKSIKLSEIVERLKDRIRKGHTNQNIIIDRNKDFITLFYVEKLGKTEFKKLVVSFWNNDRICMPENTNFKWLYELWIAGTIIEDDLKDEE